MGANLISDKLRNQQQQNWMQPLVTRKTIREIYRQTIKEMDIPQRT